MVVGWAVISRFRARPCAMATLKKSQTGAFWLWRNQMAGYCYCRGRRDCTDAVNVGTLTHASFKRGTAVECRRGIDRAAGLVCLPGELRPSHCWGDGVDC